MKYNDKYTEYQNQRYYIRPGITGWAQINGRDEISIDKKVELDYYYLQNKSFLLDIKIIFLTFIKFSKNLIFRISV